MEIISISQQIRLLLEEAGYQLRILPIEILPRLKEIIMYISKNIDSVILRERMSFMRYNPPKKFLNAKSIIITAAPQYCIRLKFNYGEKEYETLIPPTYSYHTDNLIKNKILQICEPYNYRIFNTKIPLKLLAYLSSLAEYGRNNITYINGWGSFFRLKAFYTDLECEDDVNLKTEFEFMDACVKCSACIQACPTKAITEDRYLIYAERCLTFFNERRNRMPVWIQDDWHNCLMGCMKCQFCCPLNKKIKFLIEDEIIFDEIETSMILNSSNKENLSKCTIDKLVKINMLKEYNLLARNLKALLNKSN